MIIRWSCGIKETREPSREGSQGTFIEPELVMGFSIEATKNELRKFSPTLTAEVG